MKKIISILSSLLLTPSFMLSTISCNKKHDILSKDIDNWDLYNCFLNSTSMQKIAENIENANINNQTMFRDNTNQGVNLSHVWENNWPGGNNPVIKDVQLEYANLSNIGQSFIFLYEKNSNNFKNSSFYSLNNNDALARINDNFDIKIKSHVIESDLIGSKKNDNSSIVYGNDGDWQSQTPQVDGVTIENGPIIYMDWNDAGNGLSFLGFYFTIEVNVKTIDDDEHKINIKDKNNQQVSVYTSSDGYYSYDPHWSKIDSQNTSNSQLDIGYQVELPAF